MGIGYSNFVSVIVPVYNNLRCIKNCIKSLLKQSYPNFEIVIIDDGSTDGTSDICDELAHKSANCNIKVLHTQNQGVSAARNCGIDNVKGDWILFVDSDDTVTPNYISDLISLADSPTTFVLQEITKVTESDKIDLRLSDMSFSTDNIADAINHIDILRHGYVVSKLYNRKILIDNNIRFNKRLSFAEDQIFMAEYLMYVSKIVYSAKSNYLYDFTGSNSLSNRYGEYDNEYELYQSYITSLSHLSRQFKFKTSDNLLKRGGLYLFRCIISLYSNKYSRRDRINKLKEIKSKHYDFFKSYYKPQLSQMKILKKLFTANIYLFDLTMIMKFKRK